jgi:hypothetical protein
MWTWQESNEITQHGFLQCPADPRASNSNSR